MNNEEQATELQVVEKQPLTRVEQLTTDINLIKHVMQSIMKDEEHYGIIPGCEKPSLYKAGAEKLCAAFRLAPSYVITKTTQGEHREYEITCNLTHIPSGQFYGSGLGSCSTMESKYRYRGGSRVCPACNKPHIIKGREEYGGGWVCWTKDKNGCGAKFGDDDPVITDQSSERVENADLADQYNTVMKMAKKRAMVDAVLTCTAASDLFTQDLESNKNKTNGNKTKEPGQNGKPPSSSQNGKPITALLRETILKQHPDSTEDEIKKFFVAFKAIADNENKTLEQLNEIMSLEDILEKAWDDMKKKNK